MLIRTIDQLLNATARKLHGYSKEQIYFFLNRVASEFWDHLLEGASEMNIGRRTEKYLCAPTYTAQ